VYGIFENVLQANIIRNAAAYVNTPLRLAAMRDLWSTVLLKVGGVLFVCIAYRRHCREKLLRCYCLLPIYRLVDESCDSCECLCSFEICVLPAAADTPKVISLLSDQ